MNRHLASISYATLLVMAGLLGCEKNEVTSTRCLPTALTYYTQGLPFGDSVAYIYDSESRLIQMAYYSSGPDNYFLWISTEVSYNTAGRADTVVRRELFSNGDERLLQRETYVLTYNGKGQLENVQIFSSDQLYPAGHFAFTHDDSGRLIYKEYESVGGTQRFSYTFTFNTGGNLTTYSYEDFSGNVYEGRSNTEFDNNPQFFQASPALTIINNYLTANNEPGLNNPTASMIYKIGGTIYPAGIPIRFTYTYNQHGWPLSVTDDSGMHIVDRKYYYRCP